MSGLRTEALGVRLGRAAVLTDVTLAVPPGRLAVVVGPNGAGKTTLLRALAGLLVPSAGRALLDGRPVCSLSGAERARRIAYLAQGGSVAWPLTVRDVVALGRLPHGESPDRLTPQGREAVAEALRAVAVAGLAPRPVTSLSGGERARVLLARALATRAPVLLADEPVAALDPRHQLVVLDRLRRRARDGAAVMVVMHDLVLAARFADMLILLEAGRLRAAGPPAEVLTETRLAQTFGIAAHVTAMDGQLVIAGSRPLTIDE
jgi:iron complex transport system ATP-binding protein